LQRPPQSEAASSLVIEDNLSLFAHRALNQTLEEFAHLVYVVTGFCEVAATLFAARRRDTPSKTKAAATTTAASTITMIVFLLITALRCQTL